MITKCEIEQIVISDQEMEHNAASLIFEQDGIVLVAVGSLACVRTLWFQAYRRGRLAQFRGCALPAWDYAVGKNSDVISEKIMEASQCADTKAVIVYASCMEYLTQWEPDIEELCREKEIPVKVLFRGPLTKRTSNPVKHLKELFDAMGIPLKNEEEEPKEDCEKRKAEIDKQKLDILPPIAPDFSGVMDFLSETDCNTVLISPGGCKSCMEYVDGQVINKQDNSQYGTRFTDLSVIGGCEEALADAICERFRGPKPVFLTGSAIMQTIGFDEEYLMKQLSERGKNALYFKSSGFEGCPWAVDSAMLKVGKFYFQNPGACQKNLVLITGYTSLATGGKETLQPVIRRLQKKGMEVLYLGDKWKAEKQPLPGVIWMVSAEGITVTQWLQEEYGIPCVIGRNLGETYADKLADEILSFAERPEKGISDPGILYTDSGVIRKFSFPENAATTDKKDGDGRKTVWILGEPVMTISLYRLCKLHDKENEYKTAVYIPTSGMRKVYEKLSDDWIYLRSQEEMEEIICEGTIIADEFIVRFLQNRHPDMKGIVVKFPEISGNRVQNEETAVASCSASALQG